MDKPRTQLQDLVPPRADRRRAVRYSCRLDGSLLREEQTLPCEITSLSVGGLSLRCGSEVRAGEMVNVRLHEAGAELTCRVEWVSKAGAEQRVRLSTHGDPDQNSWLERELGFMSARAEHTRQRRGGIRVACDLPATLGDRPAVIRDLGTTGARVECPGESPGSEPLLLSFAPLEKTVVVEVAITGEHDSEKGQYGVTFLNYKSGMVRDVLDMMNHLFTSRRRA